MKGEVTFDGALDPLQFEERITKIAGIGAWTAQYIAMRLGEPDAFPATDLYLKKRRGFRIVATLARLCGHVHLERTTSS